MPYLTKNAVLVESSDRVLTIKNRKHEQSKQNREVKNSAPVDV